jgi:hypothetical protein
MASRSSRQRFPILAAFAAESDSPDIIQLLFNVNADINSEYNDKRILFSYITEKNNPRIINFFSQKNIRIANEEIFRDKILI